MGGAEELDGDRPPVFVDDQFKNIGGQAAKVGFEVNFAQHAVLVFISQTVVLELLEVVDDWDPSKDYDKKPTKRSGLPSDRLH